MPSQTKQCSVLHKQKYPHKTEMVTRVSLDRSKRAQKGKFIIPSLFLRQYSNKSRIKQDFKMIME